MRRFTLVLLVAAVGYSVSVAPVAAEPDGSLNPEVTGPFSGTAPSRLGEGCAFVHQVYDATYQPGRGKPGSFHIDVCIRFIDTNVFPVNGTFQLTTRTGATLTGAVVGTITFPPVVGSTEPEDLDFTFTVSEGTRQFQHVTGTIVLDGIGQFLNPPTDEISGTLSGSLQR